MIFQIDLSVIAAKQDRELAKAIDLISSEGHYLDCTSQVYEYIETKVLVNAYLGTISIDEIRKNKEMFAPTALKRNYCTTILVGYGVNMLTINEVLFMLSKQSKLVLENGTYDWSTVKRWVDVLKNDRNYKSLNQMVMRSIDTHKLVVEHAGGAGGIRQRMEALQSEYGENVARHKLLTVFDSDKISETDAGNHNEKLISFLSECNFLWHELYKREMENYYSVKTYRLAGLVKDESLDELNSLTPQAYDYLDIEKSDNLSYTKRHMPLLAKYMDGDRLAERVSHHIRPDGINEIQEIILLLAKYV